MEAKITKYGRETICKAHAGEKELPQITHIALGEGGIFGGEPREVTGNETALQALLAKKEVESRLYVEEEDADTGALQVKMRYTVSLAKDELVGKKISEAGLVDADGGLVAYITFLEKGKDEGMAFQFYIDEVF